MSLFRKKLLDLYQRYSVSSYCTAFSYKPIIEEELLSDLDLDVNSNRVLQCPMSNCEKISNHSDSINKFGSFCASTQENSSSDE